jgi:hypothetical protein
MASKKVPRSRGSKKPTTRGKRPAVSLLKVAGGNTVDRIVKALSPKPDSMLVSRGEIECMAETLDEQIDALLGISENLDAEEGQPAIVLGVLTQLKLKRDLCRHALKGHGFLVAEVQP